jgi:hypothetical protein
MAIESTYGKNNLLEAIPDEVYVQLHTGAPGAAGTSNKASEGTRKKVTLSAASSATRKCSTAPEWTSVSASETYKYVSLWDASTSGNCWWCIQLEAEKAVTAGDTAEILAEDLTVSLT